MWQIPNETDGVGQQHTSHRTQFQPAKRRVQGGEQLVCSVHTGSRERVDQRRFARVGVTHKPNHRSIRALPRATPLLTL